ncbi:MAG: hypothetical protein K2R98_11025 [Gemmataceae bacterium]|nr:hypothetical protein [Gemmataceae bacterium]
MNAPRCWLSGLLLLLVATAPAPACSVPVFRYALERWAPDTYEVIVFHRGELNEDGRKCVKELEKAGREGGHANLEVTLVDVDKESDEALLGLWKAQDQDTKLPWMVLRMPKTVKKQPTLWSGKLESAAVAMLLDSPVRRQIAERVLKGESAVWVLLECGDKDRDDAAAKLLDDHLKNMPKALKLPELKANDPNDRIERGPDAPELRIAFSLLRLSRKDAAEQPLVQMLLRVEDDLLDLKEPLAFPVFGRGRALYALFEKGITEENIKDACAFVIGPCGCEVKRLNPGTDLFMTANWERIFGRKNDAPAVEPRPTPTPATSPATKPEKTESAPPIEEQHDSSADSGLRYLTLALVLCVAATATVAFVMGRRRG